MGLEYAGHSLEATLPEEVIQKIIKLKQDNPDWGGAKIADWLPRHDFVKISHSDVLKILKKHPETKDLVKEISPPKNPPEYEPQRFERSKPRHLYQMDITPLETQRTV